MINTLKIAKAKVRISCAYCGASLNSLERRAELVTRKEGAVLIISCLRCGERSRYVTDWWLKQGENADIAEVVAEEDYENQGRPFKH